MTLSNLPPGVTDRMIEEQVGDDEQDEKPAFPFWTVAIYLVDRAYGGPEEGGWWYDFGERVDTPLEGVPNTMLLFVLPTEAAARAFAEFLQTKLDAGPNAGRREISSVLSEGRYYAYVYNGHPPARWPEERPHYE